MDPDSSLVVLNMHVHIVLKTRHAPGEIACQLGPSGRVLDEDL